MEVGQGDLETTNQQYNCWHVRAPTSIQGALPYAQFPSCCAGLELCGAYTVNAYTLKHKS